MAKNFRLRNETERELSPYEAAENASWKDQDQTFGYKYKDGTYVDRNDWWQYPEIREGYGY